MWPFKRHSRPHRRFRRACRGTGLMPSVGSLTLGYFDDQGGLVDPNLMVEAVALEGVDYDARGLCPICDRFARIRKHRDTRHGWQKGSLLFHLRPRHERNKTWWERWLNLPERNEDDDRHRTDLAVLAVQG